MNPPLLPWFWDMRYTGPCYPTSQLLFAHLGALLCFLLSRLYWICFCDMDLLCIVLPKHLVAIYIVRLRSFLPTISHLIWKQPCMSHCYLRIGPYQLLEPTDIDRTGLSFLKSQARSPNILRNESNLICSPQISNLQLPRWFEKEGACWLGNCWLGELCVVPSNNPFKISYKIWDMRSSVSHQAHISNKTNLAGPSDGSDQEYSSC